MSAKDGVQELYRLKALYEQAIENRRLIETQRSLIDQALLTAELNEKTMLDKLKEMDKLLSEDNDILTQAKGGFIFKKLDSHKRNSLLDYLLKILD